eukprot:6783601-Prymnesium_polylepis.1
MLRRADEPLSLEDATPSVDAEAGEALLCIDFEMVCAGDGALPQSLYLQLRPYACSDETRAVWAVEPTAPQQDGTARARALIPCVRPSTGWLCPPGADTCMDRTSAVLALEPFENDHDIGDDSAVPTIEFQWVRSADLYGDLLHKCGTG